MTRFVGVVRGPHGDGGGERHGDAGGQGGGEGVPDPFAGQMQTGAGVIPAHDSRRRGFGLRSGPMEVSTTECDEALTQSKNSGALFTPTRDRYCVVVIPAIFYWFPPDPAIQHSFGSNFKYCCKQLEFPAKFRRIRRCAPTLP
jgi:hypothetical protein